MSKDRTHPASAAQQRAEEMLFPSLWTERHRRIGRGPWSFAGREYLRLPHDDNSRRIVVRKAAQLGFTEFLQNRLVHSIDAGISAMLIMPTDDDAKRHSKARFRSMVEESPYFVGMFQEVDSADVKRSLDAALYLEGSNSRSALYSVPVGMLAIDEVDRCDQDALEAAAHRLDGHRDPIEIAVSTPTVPDFGIDSRWKESDQKRWTVACPRACGWAGHLEGDSGALESWGFVRWDGWPDVRFADTGAVAKTAHIRCPKCEHRWSEADRRRVVDAGLWAPAFPGRDISGYSVNQLCSSTLAVPELVGRYFRALLDSNPERLRQFVNQTLGQPFIGEGEDITEEMIRGLVVQGEVARPTYPCLGADIGKVIHAAIGERVGERLVVTKHLALKGFEELDNVMRAEGIVSAVIDHNPERRLAEEFCRRWPEKAYRADHPEGMKETYVWDAAKSIVQIAQVSMIDILLSRIRRSTLVLGRNAGLEEAIRHLQAVNVTLQPSKRTGMPERRVVKLGPDHQAFATGYLEAAASRVVRSGSLSFQSDSSLDSSSGGDFGGDSAWGDSADLGEQAVAAWRNF